MYQVFGNNFNIHNNFKNEKRVRNWNLILRILRNLKWKTSSFPFLFTLNMQVNNTKYSLEREIGKRQKTTMSNLLCSYERLFFYFMLFLVRLKQHYKYATHTWQRIPKTSRKKCFQKYIVKTNLVILNAIEKYMEQNVYNIALLPYLWYFIFCIWFY